MAWLFWSSFHWQVVRAIGVFSVKSLAFLIEYWMATCLLGEHHNHIFLLRIVLDFWRQCELRRKSGMDHHCPFTGNCIGAYSTETSSRLLGCGEAQLGILLLDDLHDCARNHYSLVSWLTFLH